MKKTYHFTILRYHRYAGKPDECTSKQTAYKEQVVARTKREAIKRINNCLTSHDGKIYGHIKSFDGCTNTVEYVLPNAPLN